MLIKNILQISRDNIQSQVYSNNLGQNAGVTFVVSQLQIAFQLAIVVNLSPGTFIERLLFAIMSSMLSMLGPKQSIHKDKGKA